MYATLDSSKILPTSTIISDNIETLTLSNNNFREVISTSSEMQLVLMSLLPKEDIGMEMHETVSQFIRIETGEARVEINYGNGFLTRLIKDGDFVFIPSGSYHNIINESYIHPLKLYTIYAPPNHPHGKVDKYKPLSH